MSVRVFSGDCLEVLDTLGENRVDAVVCDPPYHLTSIVKRFGKANSAPAQFGTNGAFARASRGFMGKEWDGGDIAFRPDTWAAVLRVLKPGGHLVAFSGTRTYHRMVCAIEDAGFEVRDQLAWVFGSGFPKSHNLPGGFGTALKPAYEPIVLARKPLSEGTVAANVLRWGTGALNIDATRIPHVTINGGNLADNPHLRGSINGGNGGKIFPAEGERRVVRPNATGRWPANLAHDGSDEVLAGFPETKSGIMRGGTTRAAQEGPGSVCYGTYGGNATDADTYGDSGSAARFFYCAKASKSDRAGSKHPTVKPVALMRWLIRMVTPPGGTVLDPFAGTGTTGQAAGEEGFRAILIEREAEYLADIERRLNMVQEEAPLLAMVAE